MRSLRLADRGSVTAEFAMLIPAMVLILTTFLSALNLQLERIRLVQLSSDAARAAGRGDVVVQPGDSTELVTYEQGELVCVRATKQATAFKLTLNEKTCARANGR